MKVVFGMGNPGREYEETRHNVGFRVLDRVAGSVGAEISRRKFKGLLGEAAVGGERLLLVKPQTHVNLAGECARAVLGFFGVGIESLLVVTDDVNLPVGRLRCRAGGSSGGHKGLESVVQHLGVQDFPRLRVGVGRPTPGPEGGGELVSYVLGRVPEEDRAAAERAEARAAEAVMEWVANGIEGCMSRFNRPEDVSSGCGDASGSAETDKETS